MKNIVLYQTFIEISEWKRTLNYGNDELSKKMDRLVDLLRNHSHTFIIEKIEHYQQLIINLNAMCNKTRSSLNDHEFRMSLENHTITDINVLILQHQIYRNEWEKTQLELIKLTMEFNGFFVDQLNSIVVFGNEEINLTSPLVSYR